MHSLLLASLSAQLRRSQRCVRTLHACCSFLCCFSSPLECSQAIELNDGDHVFFSNRSGALLALGRGEDALADANKCIALSPTWIKGYSRKAAALHALKRFPDAIAAFRQG